MIPRMCSSGPELADRDALSGAGSLAMEQRGDDTLHGENRGVEAGDVGADAHRRLADTAQRRGIFGHRLDSQFRARDIG